MKQLEAAIEAKPEPCALPHYPAPCPLPHHLYTPWYTHSPHCWCSQCRPVYPWISPVTSRLTTTGNITVSNGTCVSSSFVTGAKADQFSAGCTPTSGGAVFQIESGSIS